MPLSRIRIFILCFFVCSQRCITIWAFSKVFPSSIGDKNHEQERKPNQQQKRRDLALLKDWAVTHKIEFRNGFDLTENDNNDWGVSLLQDAKAGSVVLTVPLSLIISSSFSSQSNSLEFDEKTVEPAVRILTQEGIEPQIPQFLLFLKILLEYSNGSKSQWYTWLESLPTSFDTALHMDQVELDCLPPLAWTMANMEVQFFKVYKRALESILSIQQQPQERQDCITEIGMLSSIMNDYNCEMILKWAFSVVFTRSWQSGTRYDVVPLGDMFNHAEPPNVIVKYDENEDIVQFVLPEDVKAGTPLFLSYDGFPTNPYMFLIMFGFVDESHPDMFSQLEFSSSSANTNHRDEQYHQRLAELGADDRSKMVFRNSDGAISSTVWDCVLFSILQQQPNEQELFHQSIINKNDTQKAMIHAKYQLEACITLYSHVNRICQELEGLLTKIDLISNTQEGYNEQRLQEGDDTAREWSSHHPRLPKIRKQNEFVLSTFYKVKNRLQEMIQIEHKRRLEANRKEPPSV